MDKEKERLCTHFGECGGCRFQNIPYPVQLREKDSLCRDLLGAAGIETDLKPIVFSPALFYYRNKMEFTFSEAQGKTVCGLHPRGEKRRVVDLSECLIFSEDAPLLLTAVREFVRESALPAYDSYRRRGFWRNLVLREGKFSNQIMLNLVTSSRGDLDQKGLIERMQGLKTKKKITSLIWTVNDSFSDAVVPEQVKILHGETTLQERLGDLSFRIYPFSFFQANPLIIGSFYQKIEELAALQGGEKILDIFCGIGPISLLLSRRAATVIGVEVDERSVENARFNAELNHAENVSFIAGPARRVLWSHLNQWRDEVDLVVVNPPRSGISPKVVKRIRELNPGRIIYSSCNPKTFFDQARQLLDTYELNLVQPFDFFPHTPHLEILGIFKRKTI